MGKFPEGENLQGKNSEGGLKNGGKILKPPAKKPYTKKNVPFARSAEGKILSLFKSLEFRFFCKILKELF